MLTTSVVMGFWPSTDKPGSSPVYVRLSLQANSRTLAGPGAGFTVLRSGGAGTVVAVGPVADDVLTATAGLDVTVLYAATARPGRSSRSIRTATC